MLFRVVISVGLLALGYYVGREIGRGESIRKDLKVLRDEEARPPASAETLTQPPPAEPPKS
ncbi:MAG: hypothetical protein P8164_07660 [Gammaproteobacteria bacterium]|jgi:hypothetical protein